VQPAGGAVVSTSAQRDINSLQQPKIRVIRDDGTGFAGRTVQVMATDTKVIFAYSQGVTDIDGYYQFKDLRFKVTVDQIWHLSLTFNQ